MAVVSAGQGLPIEITLRKALENSIRSSVDSDDQPIDVVALFPCHPEHKHWELSHTDPGKPDIRKRDYSEISYVQDWMLNAVTVCANYAVYRETLTNPIPNPLTGASDTSNKKATTISDSHTNTSTSLPTSTSPKHRQYAEEHSPRVPITVYSKHDIPPLAELQRRAAMRAARVLRGERETQRAVVGEGKGGDDTGMVGVDADAKVEEMEVDNAGISVDVVLLGDSLGDLTLLEALPYTRTSLSIGILNAPMPYTLDHIISGADVHVPSCNVGKRDLSINNTNGVVDAVERSDDDWRRIAQETLFDVNTLPEIRRPTCMEQVLELHEGTRARCPACALQNWRTKLEKYVKSFDMVLVRPPGLQCVEQLVKGLLGEDEGEGSAFYFKKDVSGAVRVMIRPTESARL
jgi:hypothetical protein